jgi:hypothetical protein
MDTRPSPQPSSHPYETGRLPMSEEELSIMDRNRRLTRRIMVPLMGLMGICGLAGGVYAMAIETMAIGFGLTFASLTMLGFTLFYIADTKKPVSRPEKFFVTGVVSSKRKRGSPFTNIYYELNLNGDKYRCFISKKDFERLKTGDIVQCERLEETSVYADRVIVIGL